MTTRKRHNKNRAEGARSVVGQPRKRSLSRHRDSPTPTPPEPARWQVLGLVPEQAAFCLAYLENGFNATLAYRETHPTCTVEAAQVAASRTLRLAKVRTFLNEHLERVWKPLQMGAEEALGRIAVLAEDTTDERVQLAALRTILEQRGKLKTPGASLDALAEAILRDRERHLGEKQPPPGAR